MLGIGKHREKGRQPSTQKKKEGKKREHSKQEKSGGGERGNGKEGIRELEQELRGQPEDLEIQISRRQ